MNSQTDQILDLIQTALNNYDIATAAKHAANLPAEMQRAFYIGRTMEICKNHVEWSKK